MGEAPACLTVTPFQSGIGQGRGNQRFLSAPNLLQQLASKLVDNSDAGRPAGPQYALSLMFLGTRYDLFAETLARFNALLPIPDLVRTERRARNLSRLEAEKMVIPSAGPLPRWQSLPLERCTLVKAAKQSMAGQLAVLESYAADSSPMVQFTLSEKASNPEKVEARRASNGVSSQSAPGQAVGGSGAAGGSGSGQELSGFEKTLKKLDDYLAPAT